MVPQPSTSTPSQPLPAVSFPAAVHRIAIGTALLLLLLAAGCQSGTTPNDQGASGQSGPLNQSRSGGPQATATEPGASGSLPNLPLRRLDGSAFSSGSLNRDSATVLFLLSPECPLCLDYAYTFRTLAEAYQTRGIRFVGLFPGEYFSELQIKKYCSRFRLEFPMVLDPDYALTRALGANTTPEALLLNERGQLVYQGGIDNWAYEVGQKRLEPTEHYLRDALEAFKSGQKPPVARTKPVGCLIE
jgi:peroxiredoxin